MDNLGLAPVTRFRPDRRYTVGAAVGMAIALALAIVSRDAPGQLLAVIAAVMLAVFVASDLLFSPRITADATMLRLNAPFARVTLPWNAIERVRCDHRSRLGLVSKTLEIDGGAVFAVFSRRALGVDPDEAATRLEAYRAAASPGR